MSIKTYVFRCPKCGFVDNFTGNISKPIAFARRGIHFKYDEQLLQISDIQNPRCYCGSDLILEECLHSWIYKWELDPINWGIEGRPNAIRVCQWCKKFDAIKPINADEMFS